MEPESPKVSIVMNCHNGETFLRQAIDSVYAQDYDDWELIFWDNASTDSSPEIAKSYDHRLKYFRAEELSTLGAARGLAVSQCSGEWIAFLDTDDIWHKNKLESQIQKLERSEFVLAYAGVEEIDREGNHIRDRIPGKSSGLLLESLLLQFDINMVTPIIKRQVLIEQGLNFDPNITASEEYNLFLRVAAKGPVLVQNEILGKYRVYPDSLTDKNISKWGDERRYTLKQLEAENSELVETFKEGLEEAYARSVYYDACYYASTGDYENAQSSMRSIAGKSVIYRLLHLASHSPWLWKTLQRSKRHGIVGELAKVLS